jgi:adenine specific DNA methylase Mod
MEGKKANEKKNLVYELKSIENKSLTFNVIYSEKGKTTKTADIVKVAKKSDIELNEEDLKKAFQVFEKQSNVDYFINKDAKKFLTEQLDMWIYQYMFSQEVDFNMERFNQIGDFKKVASKLINFISQFENELVKIWNKPRFTLNSNYVISLKTLKKELLHDEYIRVFDLIKEEIKINKDFFDDIIFSIKDVLKKPLQKIYVDNVSLINDIFEVSYVKQFSTQEDLNDFLLKNNNSNEIINDIFDRDKKLTGYFASYDVKNAIKLSIEDIYFDTKYITFDYTNLLNLIESKDLVDGYLIKSENYQALNSILNRYKNKIDLVYIDPPFNTGDDFAYIDKFQDSTWLSLLNDRLELTKELLCKNGNLYLHLDHNCNYLGRELLQKIFPDCFRREIIWNTSPNPSGFKTKALNFVRQHDTIFYCSKSDNPIFNKMWRLKEESNKEYGWLDFFSEDKENIYIEKCKKNERELERILVKNNEKLELISLGDVWNDVYSMMFTQNMTRENWSEDNTQKPENLLRRIIQTSTNQKNIVMDFFVGSGTTIATAHKLNRKWIGIDMGQFIEKITLKRMKTVLLGDIKPKLSEDI